MSGSVNQSQGGRDMKGDMRSVGRALVMSGVVSVAATILARWIGGEGGGDDQVLFGKSFLSALLDPFGESQKVKVKEVSVPPPEPQNVPELSKGREADEIARAKAEEAEKVRRRRAFGGEGTVLTDPALGFDDVETKRSRTRKTVLGAG